MVPLKEENNSLLAALKSKWFYLLCIFVLGLGIRMIGLRYGSPLLVHSDEENVVKSALWFDPDTGFERVAMNRPAQVQIEMHALMYRVYSYLRWQEPLLENFFLEELRYYVAGRFLNAVMGALIPIAAFLVGKQFKPDFSMPAAILFCLYPSYIKHSHFISPDIHTALWTLMVMLFAIRYAKGVGKYSLWLAVFFVAVNTADKYPGIISAALVLGALILRFSDESKKTGSFDKAGFAKTALKCFGAFFLFLFLVAPNIYINFDAVIKALIHQSNPIDLASDGLTYFQLAPKFMWYFFHFLNWFLTVFVIAGFVGLIVIKDKTAILLLYGFLYLLLMSVLGKDLERWALPMYVSPLLIGAFGVSWLFERLAKKPAVLLAAKLVFIAGLALLALAGISESLVLSLPDTRVVAIPYLEENGITENNSYFDGFTTFYPRDYPLVHRPIVAQLGDYPYAVISSYQYMLFYNKPHRAPQELQFYKLMRERAKLLKIYEPYKADTIKKQWTLLEYLTLRLFNATEPRPYYTGPVQEIYAFE